MEKNKNDSLRTEESETNDIRRKGVAGLRIVIGAVVFLTILVTAVVVSVIVFGHAYGNRDRTTGEYTNSPAGQRSAIEPSVRVLPSESSPAFVRITNQDWSNAPVIPNMGKRIECRLVTRAMWQVRADFDPQRTSKPLPPADSPGGSTRLYEIPNGSQTLQFRIAPGQEIQEGQVMYWYCAPRVPVN